MCLCDVCVNVCVVFVFMCVVCDMCLFLVVYDIYVQHSFMFHSTSASSGNQVDKFYHQFEHDFLSECGAVWQMDDHSFFADTVFAVF